jgi:hypothetical protein
MSQKKLYLARAAKTSNVKAIAKFEILIWIPHSLRPNRCHDLFIFSPKLAILTQITDICAKFTITLVYWNRNFFLFKVVENSDHNIDP